MYVCMSALGLRCCAQAFSSCSKWGLLSLWCMGFSLQWLLLLRSTVSRRTGFISCGTRASVVVARGFQSTGSVVVAHGLSCSMACGIFPDQGLNPCPLHWQADSYPLRHQGSGTQYLNISKTPYLIFVITILSIQCFSEINEEFYSQVQIYICIYALINM